MSQPTDSMPIVPVDNATIRKWLNGHSIDILRVSLGPSSSASEC